MTDTSTYRRLTRRETHSPKSGLAIGIAVAVILACAYAGVEIVLAFFGLRPLLAAPADMASALVHAPSAPVAALGVGGIVVLVLGVLTIIAAVRPSRRPRRVLESERTATVVDDVVIASALARRASSAANVDPDNVVATVGRSTAVVRVTPASGIPVDREAVAAAVSDQLEQYQVRPRLRSTVRVRDTGKVGS